MTSPRSTSLRRSECKGSKCLLAFVYSMFAGVDIQQKRDEVFGCQMFLVLKMDARVPLDCGESMEKRALRKHFAESGLMELVRPDDQQHTLKHCNILIEAIVAGIEPLEFRRKVENNMRFDLVTHDPDALFNSN